MNRLYLIPFFLFVIKTLAQDNRLPIQGIITSDSLVIGNIHIVNKTSQKGAISNNFGKFTIPVKENDTLIFSGIQFYSKELQITKQQIKSKFIIIDLFQKINTLNEIEIRAHDLTGNLIVDNKNAKDTIKKISPSAIFFENINFEIPSMLVAEMLDLDKLPNPTDPMIPIGGDLIGLLSPLIKAIGEIGKTKRDIKTEEIIYRIKATEAPDKIRKEFGDQFFINDLNISVEKIDAFIIYCKPKGVIKLYLENKKIEMIDLFFKESKLFNQTD